MKYRIGQRSKVTRDWVLLGSLYALAFLAGMLLTSNYYQWLTSNRLEATVYQVCEYTRTTAANETACGIAQDAAHAEYLCTAANSSPLNNCWVEVK
jgi:hypothetical protein